MLVWGHSPSCGVSSDRAGAGLFGSGGRAGLTVPLPAQGSVAGEQLGVPCLLGKAGSSGKAGPGTACPGGKAPVAAKERLHRGTGKRRVLELRRQRRSDSYGSQLERCFSSPASSLQSLASCWCVSSRDL